MQRSGGFKPHPKIEKLKTILIQHFGSKISDEGGEDGDDTKVMVFSSYRGVVDEIVQELDKERPLIRAARFIGQGVDKQGNKGLAQKDQLEVRVNHLFERLRLNLRIGHQKIQGRRIQCIGSDMYWRGRPRYWCNRHHSLL